MKPIQSESIHNRLAVIRRRAGLSLRALAAYLLHQCDYEVTHSTIRQYENGTTVPIEYVSSVCLAFDLNPNWLLFGDGPVKRTDPSAMEQGFEQMAEIVQSIRELHGAQNLRENIKNAWEAFIEQSAEKDVLRPMIIASWKRARDAGVRTSQGGHVPCRLPKTVMRKRIRAAEPIVSAARPHVDWLSQVFSRLAHVIYVVCHDGIIVYSTASHSELTKKWNLLPGYDWSERAMGTNGAGTAIATGKIVAVLGPEHFREDFHDVSCMAAPIKTAAGKIVGAIDLCTSFEDAKPEHLALVAYASQAISRELHVRVGDGSD